MRLAVFAIVVVPAVAVAAPVRTEQDDPHAGIHHETWVDSAIPATIQLVKIDLTAGELALYATKEADRGLTTSDLADKLSAQVAINGGPFQVADFRPEGLAVGDSTQWSNTADNTTAAVFHLRRVGERTVAAIIPPEVVVTLDDLPDGTQGVVSGWPLLVRNGAVESQFDCNDPVTIACERAPRSAVAVSADGNTMWLAVVDGWQAASFGMTAAELASFLRGRGANMAMGLDGGSSSTLVMDGTLVNHPSDGVQRAVANHLAIKFGSLPKDQIVGLVCEHDIFACKNDPSLKLAGAHVTLDDGREQTVGSDAFYDFTNITPRYVCVTVKKAGYHSKRKCILDDPADQPTYNSVALEPGTDAVDAGTDDGGEPVDGGFGDDAGANGDAGTNPAMGPGGGCCQSGGDPPVAIVSVTVLALAGWRRRYIKIAA
ncbi:MAG TPA: phosphodiester glycosidase family protein [Kofleriaceae bacterium]|nr:phosphodiester glycosidase family protein [Kofleriaceae bacterium]